MLSLLQNVCDWGIHREKSLTWAPGLHPGEPQAHQEKGHAISAVVSPAGPGPTPAPSGALGRGHCSCPPQPGLGICRKNLRMRRQSCRPPPAVCSRTGRLHGPGALGSMAGQLPQAGPRPTRAAVPTAAPPLCQTSALASLTADSPAPEPESSSSHGRWVLPAFESHFLTLTPRVPSSTPTPHVSFSLDPKGPSRAPEPEPGLQQPLLSSQAWRWPGKSRGDPDSAGGAQLGTGTRLQACKRQTGPAHRLCAFLQAPGAPCRLARSSAKTLPLPASPASPTKTSSSFLIKGGILRELLRHPGRGEDLPLAAQIQCQAAAPSQEVTCACALQVSLGPGLTRCPDLSLQNKIFSDPLC